MSRGLCFCLVFWTYFNTGLTAQTDHLIILDTDGIEELWEDGVFKELRQMWDANRDQKYPTETWWFYAEFGSKGEFDSFVIKRYGYNQIGQLLKSDSLRKPNRGEPFSQETTLRQLAKWADQSNALERYIPSGRPFKVSLFTANADVENLSSYDHFFSQLAAVLGCSSASGQLRSEDEWTVHHLKTKKSHTYERH